MDSRNGGRDLEEWLLASVSHAERELPDLIDLPPAALRRELTTRAELLTAGMMQVLISYAHEAAERYPRRAHELTSIVVELCPSVAGSPQHSAILVRLQALAWKEHARALSHLLRNAEAREALATARRLFRQTRVYHWYVATVDLLDAPLLHDEGQVAEALAMVRKAAAEFALHHDYERLVEARMLEMSMQWNAGDLQAADETWKSATQLAESRNEPALLAMLSAKAGQLHLRQGDVHIAAGLLAHAVKIFDEEGMELKAARTRWHLAETAAARERFHEAISEFHKVRATLLAAGHPNDAAIAAIEVVELLFLVDREREIPPYCESLLDAFRSTLPANAFEALAYLATLASAGTISREQTADVRRFLEDLALEPRKRFFKPFR